MNALHRMTDNWKDLKQWREKESGRIDECRQDIDQLLGSMQDVKRDVNDAREEFKRDRWQSPESQ
jgi:hypothetical protein